ncbi:MAG: DUF58 domain-containing protein [Nocardioidaceae bacterium]
MAILPKPSVWSPTKAHVRSVVLGVVLVTWALVVYRADLLVIATPLVIIGVWSTLRRPRMLPTSTTQLLKRTVREGEATLWRTTVSPVSGMMQAVVVLPKAEWFDLQPPSGARTAYVGAHHEAVTELSLAVVSNRWGRRTVPAGLAAATGVWGAFRWRRDVDDFMLTTLPVPAAFDATAPTPHPAGLVGVNRSARPGDGSEFASIRPFQVGDRLRRIHWPVSLRTGSLHVTSTWSDQDSQIILLVDANNDLGGGDGIHVRASSLDITVRAAGAIAEHYLRRGDRVGLRVFGTTDKTFVPASTGQPHLRRVLGRLSVIKAGSNPGQDVSTQRFGIGAGATVIMLSPCMSTGSLQQAVTLVRRGLTVIVVDTLPAELGEPGQTPEALAWRIRILQRFVELQKVIELGVPVVPWRGPGSLDQVLRDLTRRAAAPRLARR